MDINLLINHNHYDMLASRCRSDFFHYEIIKTINTVPNRKQCLLLLIGRFLAPPTRLHNCSESTSYNLHLLYKYCKHTNLFQSQVFVSKKTNHRSTTNQPTSCYLCFSYILCTFSKSTNSNSWYVES